MITKMDDLVTNALAGMPSVYFVASFHVRRLWDTAPERVSLAGACDVERAKAETSDTPSQNVRAEVMRLYTERLVTPVQRRVEVDGIVTIEYIALPTRRAA